ncbi:MAG: 23S rRNA (guanosine(2251)-2'-O)-methyltransferase RlmB [Spirochaetaceae bacterium]|jgi:23S rRNA (guanosine2251-2'-O)-methyltransferase|nr:23S rRNA (guanosine(2251)-2'-O)-methyltransferase RlmB [Spirochaetaceae bacterium]
MYLTGFHAIEERIRAGKSGIISLMVSKAGPRAKEIQALAQGAKIRIDRTGSYDLNRLAPDNRGIALYVEESGEISRGSPASLEEFINKIDEAAKQNSLVLLLDEITDPHNYGAILRSSAQFDVDLVISRKRRSAKNADTVATSSAGAWTLVPQLEVANLTQAIEQLKDAGYWVYGADMDGEPAWKIKLQGKVALVLGSEGSGLSRLLKTDCDGIITIPTSKKIDSLNVSVAAGILLYEVWRQQGS